MNLTPASFIKRKTPAADRLANLHEVRCEWLAFRVRVIQQGEYSNASRMPFKALTLEIEQLKDWRSHAVKTCLKKGLPATLLNVVDRSLKYIDECEATAKELLAEEQAIAAAKVMNAEYEALADRIIPEKNEYIEGFDDYEEGVKAWISLIDLVRTGYITEKQLPDYGITL